MSTSLQASLRENVCHGTPDFPVSFYRDTYEDVPAHWHGEMEVTLVRGGSLDYAIDLAAYQVSEGDLLLIRPDTLHAAHRHPDCQAVTDSVVFHLNLAGLSTPDLCTMQYIRPLQNGAWSIPSVVHPEDPHYADLKDCFLRLWDCREEDLPCRALALKAAVFQLLQILCRFFAVWAGRSRGPDRQIEKVKLALAYLRSHYTESITIPQLAALSGFCPAHFMSVFKKAVGSTCIDYLNEYRLTLASADLRETSQPITQIAMNHGFQTVSYFNRVFRRKYNMTPREYRRAILARQQDPSPALRNGDQNT